MTRKRKRATVTVPEDQQSLAIGKEGQNARLANKLTKWKIDIKGITGVFAGEFAEEGVGSGVVSEKVVGVWDAEIKRFNDAEEARNKTKKKEEEDKIADEEQKAEETKVEEVKTEEMPEEAEKVEEKK